jgi:histone H3/H4
MNVITFLPRLQRQVASNFNFKKSTLDSLNGFLDSLCEKLVEVSYSLQVKTGKITTDANTVQTAVMLLFPESLAKYAVSEATSAVLRYQQRVETKKKTEKKDDSSSFDSKNVESVKSGDKVASVPRSTRSLKAGLTLPTSRVDRFLKRYSKRVSPQASVFLTAVLEFLAKELIESASEVTSSGKRKQISVHDLNRCVWGDRTLPVELLKEKGKSSTESGSKSGSVVKSVSVLGDLDFQQLAKHVNWGVVQNGWKGVYTETTSRKKQKKEESVPESSSSLPPLSSNSSVVV